MKRVVKQPRGDDVRVDLLGSLAMRWVFEKKREQVLWVLGLLGRG